jgi:glutamate synthase (NADPH/NADH) large chain
VLLGWRDVPVDNSDLAEPAKKLEPVIRQVFIGRGKRVTVTDALERKLYVIRKASGHAIQALQLQHGKEFYVPSMSARTVCYKGMLLAYQVGEYYLDLKDARVESAIAMVHQRFSTNTFPSWDLAHPFRLICHNGEINTVRGNQNWVRARQGAISSPILGKDIDKLWPLIYDGQSDSASFDNALELLVMGGYSVAHAMMMMIPEAWENHALMDPARRAFYEYHAAMMEPWDGPAAARSARRSTATACGRRATSSRTTTSSSWAPSAAACRCPRSGSSRSGACSPARCSSSTWKKAGSSTTRSSRTAWRAPGRTPSGSSASACGSTRWRARRPRR